MHSLQGTLYFSVPYLLLNLVRNSHLGSYQQKRKRRRQTERKASFNSYRVQKHRRLAWNWDLLLSKYMPRRIQEVFDCGNEMKNVSFSMGYLK